MFQDQIFAKVREKLPGRPFRVGLPEDLDPRVQEAMKRLCSLHMINELFLFSSEAHFLKIVLLNDVVSFSPMVLPL